MPSRSPRRLAQHRPWLPKLDDLTAADRRAHPSADLPNGSSPVHHPSPMEGASAQSPGRSPAGSPPRLRPSAPPRRRRLRGPIRLRRGTSPSIEPLAATCSTAAIVENSMMSGTVSAFRKPLRCVGQRLDRGVDGLCEVREDGQPDPDAEEVGLLGTGRRIAAQASPA